MVRNGGWSILFLASAVWASSGEDISLITAADIAREKPADVMEMLRARVGLDVSNSVITMRGVKGIAVFVDGCFWHRCPDHGTDPAANGAWWRAKLDANVSRDRDTDCRLAQAGWTVVRIWEHEPPAVAADRVMEELRTLRAR